MPDLRLDDLARQLDARLEGDPAATVSRPDNLAEAGPGALSFLANPKYASLMAHTRATAVVVDDGYDGPTPCALLRTPTPDLTFARATRLLGPPPPPRPEGIHPTALVAPDAVVEEGVAIGPYVVVESGARLGARTILYPHVYVGHGAVLGPDCVLHPRVTLYHGVELGARVTIQAGAVLGADGFGYLWNGQALEKTPQIGIVRIDDDVEIGANACIDRARFGATRVGTGSKIDNLVDVAHNVRIGRHCAFASQVGLAGSATVGDGVMMGGQVGVGGHLHIGDRAVLLGKAGITRNIPPGTTQFGIPSQERRTYLEEHRHLRALGKLRQWARRVARHTGIPLDAPRADTDAPPQD